MGHRMRVFRLFHLVHQLTSHRLATRLGPTAVAVGLWVCSSMICPVMAAGHGSLSVSQREATLKEMLENGLQARQPSEFAFIGRVVAMVEDGKLPLALVRGTFNWARKKKPYPFPYFARGLKQRAAKIGIEVK